MGNLVNPLPAVPDLEKYFISLKAITEHPIAPYDTVTGKNVVLQSNERQHKFIVNFLFPATHEVMQRTIYPLLRYLRIAPITNFLSPDLATLLGKTDPLVVVALEELRLEADPARNTISAVLTIIPTDSDQIGGPLKYRHTEDIDRTSPTADERTLLYKALKLAPPPVKFRSNTRLEFYTTGVVMSRAEGRAKKGDKKAETLHTVLDKAIELDNIVSKTLFIRNLIAAQPVQGSSVPFVQYMGYSGAYFKISLKAHLDDPAVKEQFEYMISSFDILMYKKSLMESLEALTVRDDLLSLIAATEGKDKVGMVCTRIFTSTVPGESGWIEYEMHFAEQDTAWLSKKEYVQKFDGISEKEFTRFITDLGKRASNTEDIDLLKFVFPVRDSLAVTERGALTLVNKDTLIQLFTLYYKDLLDKYGERTQAYSFIQRSRMDIGPLAPKFIKDARVLTQALIKDATWSTSTVLYFTSFATKHSLVDEFSRSVFSIFSGAPGDYRQIVHFLVKYRKNIQPKFWELLATVLLERKPYSELLATHADLGRVNDTFTLAYVQYNIKNLQTGAKDYYTNDIYRNIPLPTYGQLGIFSKVGTLCGSAEDFGVRISGTINHRPTDKVPPYAFYTYKNLPVKTPTDKWLNELLALYSGYVFDTGYNITTSDLRLLESQNTDEKTLRRVEGLAPRILRDMAPEEKRRIKQLVIAGAQPGDTTEQAREKYLQRIKDGKIQITLKYKWHGKRDTTTLHSAVAAALVSKLIIFPEDIELTDDMIKNANNIRLPIQDLHGDLPEKIKARLKRDVPKIYYSPVRLFPVVRAYIVHHYGKAFFKTAQLTALRALASISVTSSKDDPALAVVKLVDPFGLAQYAVTPRKNEYQKKNGKWERIYFPAKTEDLFAQITDTETLLGSELLVKAGYGGHIGLLETIFTGRITENNPGPPATIIAQGWKAELMNRTVTFYTEASDDMPLHKHVVRLIQSGDPQGGFGEYIPKADAELIEKQLATTGVSSPWIAMAKLQGAGVTSHLQTSTEAGLDLRLLNIYYPAPSKSRVGGLIKTILKIGHSISDPSQQWAVPLQPVWTALSEASRHTWNMVVDVRPMDTGATIFFGRPDQEYIYSLFPLSKATPAKLELKAKKPVSVTDITTATTLLRGNPDLGILSLAKVFTDTWPTTKIKPLTKSRIKQAYPYFSTLLENKDEKALIEFKRFLYDQRTTLRPYPVNVEHWLGPPLETMLLKAAGYVLAESESADRGRRVKTNFIEAIDNRFRPFRRYYPIDSSLILGNQVAATEREMANSIRVHYPLLSDQFNIFTDLLYDRADNYYIAPNTEWAVFPPNETHTPQLRGPGLSWHQANIMSVQLLKEVNEINAHDEMTACKLAITNLTKEMRKMYRGELVMSGHFYWPWDVIMMRDPLNSMYGPIEVDRVVHLYDPQRGWISTITPHLWASANSDTDLIIYAAYEEAMSYVSSAIDIVFDVWTGLSLVTALASGGTTASVGAALGNLKKLATKAVEKRLLSKLIIASAKAPGSITKAAIKVFLGKGEKLAARAGLRAGAKATIDYVIKNSSKELYYTMTKNIVGKWALGVLLANIIRKVPAHELLSSAGTFAAPMLYGSSVKTLPVKAMPLIKDGAPYVAGLISAPLLYSSPDLARTFAGFEDALKQALFDLVDYVQERPRPGSSAQLGTSK